MKSKNAEIGTLVTIYQSESQAMTVRVQDHLSVQFTYSKPDDDEVIGICRFDGDFEDDLETEDKPWLFVPGRRKQRAGRRS